MRWNLRLTAAERGIWKSTEMRRRLADAGLDISAGKMSAWGGGAVLECDPAQLLVCEPDKVAARRPARKKAASAAITPRLGRHRSTPPA